MRVLLTKKEPPRWLLDMWKEIDDITFGKGFDYFTEDAVCNLGVADWKGREAIRAHRSASCDRVLGWRLTEDLPRCRGHDTR